MQIIDLGALGEPVIDRFVTPSILSAPHVSPVAPAEDDLAAALLDSEFVVGSVDVYSSTGFDGEGWDVSNTPLVVHPTRGVWFAEVSEDPEPFPDIEEWRFETYFQAWSRIADTFGWSEPPIRCFILFARLDRRDCIADFRHAPFDVYFRDDLASIGAQLLAETAVVGRAQVQSLLGALHEVAHVIPPSPQQTKSCTPRLAEELWGAGYAGRKMAVAA